MSDRTKRILIVTSHREITSFPAKQGGGTTTLYEIFATNPQGVPIDAKQFPLRAFWEPSDDEIGKPVEYEVEAYRHERYGLTYTLHRPKGSNGLKGSVDALRAEVKELTGRVEALEARQGGAPAPAPAAHQGSAPPLPPTDEPPGVQGASAMNPPTRPSRGTAPRTSDDDIPF